jgi:hypothetical protein
MRTIYKLFRTIRLDTESKQAVDQSSSSANSQSFTSLSRIIESEFAHLSMNVFSYELKPMYDKVHPAMSILKTKDSLVNNYELTCRLTEINMPIVPPLKLKLTSQYPRESPEVLSLTASALTMMPTKLENSGRKAIVRTRTFE